jgi:hypothetical protein
VRQRQQAPHVNFGKPRWSGDTQSAGNCEQRLDLKAACCIAAPCQHLWRFHRIWWRASQPQPLQVHWQAHHAPGLNVGVVHRWADNVGTAANTALTALESVIQKLCNGPW